MTVSWDSVLLPQRCSPEIMGMIASGGRSGTGREQRSLSDAGFWQITISGINVRNGQQAAAYRAMAARLRLGEDIILPIFDKYKPVGSWSSASSAALATNAALRSTQVVLSVSGIDLRPGHYFSLGDRLHLITELVAVTGTAPLENMIANDSPWSDHQPWSDAVSATANYTVKIAPPLRADYSAGDVAQFRYPIVRCVIKDPSDGNLDLELARFGSPSLTFIESI